jgi:hypothetical protein
MNYVSRFNRLSKLVRFSDNLPGGKADNMKIKQFMKNNSDKEDFLKGIKHEMEHTNDPNIAAEIVMDHEVEQKDKTGKYDYYENLEKSNMANFNKFKEIFSKIRKRKNKWQVTDSSGDNVLGEHSTKEEALSQLRAIEISKKNNK